MVSVNQSIKVIKAVALRRIPIKGKLHVFRNTTLRKEFALAVVFISPMMNEITIRMSPVRSGPREAHSGHE